MIRPYRAALFLTATTILTADGIHEVVFQRDWLGYWSLVLGMLSLAFFFHEVNRAFGRECD